MPKRKTHEEFIEEMRIKHPNIEVLDKYVDNNTKIKVRCKVDGHEWYSTRRRLINQNHGCPKCYGNNKKSHEDFIKEFYEKNPNAENIEILSEYKNNKTKIKCCCKVDGHIWYAIGDSLLRGHGCPKCAGNINKNHEQFVEEMKFINPNIEILGEYINCKTKIKCRCRIDGEIWYPIPSDLLKGKGCNKCAIRNNTGENHYNWKSNLTEDERVLSRKNHEYNQFVKTVLEYFNYTCQLSGQYGGKLSVHHLNGYNWCIEGRMDINNVIVITKEIHKEFHDIYGRGNNTKEQFEEFIQNYYNKDLEDRDIV